MIINREQEHLTDKQYRFKLIIKWKGMKHGIN